MAAFLAFLGESIAHSPSAVTPFSEQQANRIDQFVEGIEVRPDEPLGDEVLLD